MSEQSQLTPEQYVRYGEAIRARNIEMLDGFAIVGFHPVTKEPVIVHHADDPKTRFALNDMMRTAIILNTASLQPPPTDGQASKA